MYDILIVGGGTAGLTAAVYACRAGKRVAVLEGRSFGGQITGTDRVDNYPALPGVSGIDYAAALVNQATALGAETAYAQVTAAQRTPEGFLLRAGDKTWEGRALILATGAQPRLLDIPGEKELTGRGVSYCAVCDGAFFAGRDVAVAGGGDSALQAALFLSNRCKTVYLIHRREAFRGERVNVEAVKARENIRPLLPWRVTAAEGDGALTGVALTHAHTGQRRTLAVAGLFVEIGRVPDNAPFAHLAALDGQGYFLASEDCCTGTPGVFAAGDCREKALRQLTTAAADGSVAATAACRWLERSV